MSPTVLTSLSVTSFLVKHISQKVLGYNGVTKNLMGTSFQKIIAKCSRHFDYSLSRYSTFCEGPFDVFKTKDKTDFRVSIKHRLAD